ncbi:hypothetical protein BT69DRAFT_1348604 [Atractiella rhizophila]|nr:hypothetical protein BT69DRAFT_1348604 [Atractiella rhizophila]
MSVPPLEEQLDLVNQRASLEEVLSASRVYLTACFAIYGWDFILTFPGEYKAMWKAERWTLVRVSFFFNRYWGLLTFVLAMCLLWLEFTPKTCNKFHILEPAATTILFLNCEFLLGTRVWVMWNRRKWIAYFFGIFAIAGTAVQVLSFAEDDALRLLPGLRGCISIRGRDHYIWIYWVPLLLYDTTATIFMLVPLISHWREAPPTRLISIFLRDGIAYFIIVSICNLVNVVYFSIPTEINPTLNCPLTLTFTTIMASRIVLHLRSVAPGSNSREGGSSRSGSSGRINTVPKFRSFNRPDFREPPDAHIHSVGRRIEGGLQVSNAVVMVNVEVETNVEKRLEAAEDAEGLERDYRASDEGAGGKKK